MSRENPTREELETYAAIGLLVCKCVRDGKSQAEGLMLAGACMKIAGDVMDDPPPKWVQEANKRGLQLFAAIMAVERAAERSNQS